MENLEPNIAEMNPDEMTSISRENALALIKADRGYNVANNLNKIDESNQHEIISELIEVGKEYDVARNLDKIKTIVIVGSAKPEKFKDSDAPINVGVAIGAINVLKKGVYITMNGRVYDWHECEKESRTGKFIKRTS